MDPGGGARKPGCPPASRSPEEPRASMMARHPTRERVRGMNLLRTYMRSGPRVKGNAPCTLARSVPWTDQTKTAPRQAPPVPRLQKLDRI